MATMGNYCKAYPITRLQEFAGWKEKPVPPAETEPDAENGGAPRERYLFLQENLVVTDGIFQDERIVFDDLTAEWTEFCHTRLEFSIPEMELLPVFSDSTSEGDLDERTRREAV